MLLLIAAFALARLPAHSAPEAACCVPSMAEFAGDPAFLAAHFRPRKADLAGAIGRNVTYRLDRGPNARGYYVPPKPKARAAVILVHEYWGLNDDIRQAAETLRRRTGYAVLAVDLYDGKTTADPQTAGRLMAGVDDARCLDIVGGAVTDLKRGVFGFKPKTIGTVGYCFGGGWSERAAIAGGARVQACVVYYGLPDIRPASLARLKAPVLMFQATQDRWIDAKVVNGFEAAMRAAGKSLEVRAYDANHAFANPSNPHYDAFAATDAMSRELAFFKLHL